MRFLRTIAVILLAFIGILPMAAQEERPLMMSLSIGPNFNTGGSEHSDYFGTRPDVTTQFNWRISGAFACHWAAYAELGMSFFRVKTDNVVNNIMEDLLSMMSLGLTKIKPSLGAGITYIAEKGRWQFQPRVGIGWMNAGNSDRNTEINGKESRLNISRSPWFANAGASIGYRMSKVCSTILDVNYRHPLQACKATYTTQLPEEQPVTTVRKSRSWANDLSVSLGIQVQMDMRAKKQK